MASGKLTSSSLDWYSCIALSGVATEYLLFGQAEGGLNDVQQLDSLLKALQVRCLDMHLVMGEGQCILKQKRDCNALQATHF